jgi:TolB protein
LPRLILAALAFLILAVAPARAQLTIEIVGGAGTTIPIAIVPFENEGTWPLGISGIVAGDLQRSGLFRQVSDAGIVPRPTRAEDVRLGDFRARGADAVVVGSMRPMSDGRVEVRFALLDAVKQVQLASMSYVVTPAQFRATGHKIADVIYEKLTGDKGVFSTRIAYIVKTGKRYELQVADADGYGPQAVRWSSEPIISPTWSPDGTRLAYVSFENKKPIVYVQSLITGQHRAVANFWGSNSAPAWSPDGRTLAVVLSKDGGSQIYFMNPEGKGEPRRMTHSSAIDTEPNFSPDGALLIFTSDRGGTPQIYGMPVTGGEPRRLTFEGSYSVSPRFSPDGKSFTFIQRNNGRFNVAVQDFATRQVQVLTDGTLDESPSYAPNGRMILYATEVKGRGMLSAVSSDGRVKQRLSADAGDVREPAWGPLLK